MRSRTEERDPGSRFILERAEQGHLDVEMLPNGSAMVSFDPDRRVLVFTSERALGKFLAALVVDGGGAWRLCPGRDPEPFRT